jgi:2-polyprenyl-3-methyl-5-hydroxy-6-metoxy-1,4-benzoquinol methylase
MVPSSQERRQRAFGQSGRLTPVDRFGVWLSAVQLRRRAGDATKGDIVDIGCGYHASFAHTLFDNASTLTLVDVALTPELIEAPGIHAITGHLPEVLDALADMSADLVVCNSVLEHLWEPELTLEHVHRILRPGGTAMINVPSWRGKRFLEIAAFRLGVSPAAEMDDHKRYYDPRDLWPLLVRAGFVPHNIRCFRHKFGLNTFSVCRKAEALVGA